MPKLSLLDRLNAPEPLLADGAMGTMIHARAGSWIDACFDAYNLSRPEIILDIHRAYLNAGARL